MKLKINKETKHWLDTEGKRLEQEFCRILEICMLYAKEREIPAKEINIERLMHFIHDGRISLGRDVSS